MKKFSISIVFTVFFLTAGVFQAAHIYAAEPDREGVYTLGEIVVSGQANSVESVSTIHKVTAEEITNSGARNLKDV